MADVSFAGISGYYLDVNSEKVALGDMFAVYLDLDNDGINGADLINYTDYDPTWLSVINTESFEWDSDDYLVWYGAMNGSADGVFNLNASHGHDPYLYTSELPEGYDPGDALYVLYFPGLSGSATTPGNITQLGYYTQDNWVAPPDPGSTDLAAVVTDATGLQTAIAVPEPASALLALIGGGVAFVVRRRGNKFAA